MELTQQKCIPCEAGGDPLKPDEIEQVLPQLNDLWQVVDNLKIKRDFKFKDFVENIKFINKVADLAEEQGHHPDLHVHYNQLTIELWTHAVGGLSLNDFIVAAKINKL